MAEGQGAVQHLVFRPGGSAHAQTCSALPHALSKGGPSGILCGSHRLAAGSARTLWEKQRARVSSTPRVSTPRSPRASAPHAPAMAPTCGGGAGGPCVLPGQLLRSTCSAGWERQPALRQLMLAANNWEHGCHMHYCNYIACSVPACAAPAARCTAPGWRQSPAAGCRLGTARPAGGADVGPSERCWGWG